MVMSCSVRRKNREQTRRKTRKAIGNGKCLLSSPRKLKENEKWECKSLLLSSEFLLLPFIQFKCQKRAANRLQFTFSYGNLLLYDISFALLARYTSSLVMFKSQPTLWTGASSLAFFGDTLLSIEKVRADLGTNWYTLYQQIAVRTIQSFQKIQNKIYGKIKPYSWAHVTQLEYNLINTGQPN